MLHSPDNEQKRLSEIEFTKDMLHFDLEGMDVQSAVGQLLFLGLTYQDVAEHFYATGLKLATRENLSVGVADQVRGLVEPVISQLMQVDQVYPDLGSLEEVQNVTNQVRELIESEMRNCFKAGVTSEDIMRELGFSFGAEYYDYELDSQITESLLRELVLNLPSSVPNQINLTPDQEEMYLQSLKDHQSQWAESPDDEVLAITRFVLQAKAALLSENSDQIT